MKKNKPLLSKYSQSLRIKTITPYLNGNILEIGCGISRIPSLMKSKQIYVGIDKNPNIINRLRSEYPNHRFICNNIEVSDLDLNGKFDTILMLSLVEHLENPGQVINKIRNHLSPLGKIIVTTPTSFGGMVHKIGALLGLFSKQAAKDHKSFFSSRTLIRLVENNSLILQEHHIFLFFLNQLFIFKMNH
jgi:2-polyprenyl-3-methyl-5-hydroxy-6-metoxy-1,4-benzoquinol methylase